MRLNYQLWLTWYNWIKVMWGSDRKKGNNKNLFWSQQTALYYKHKSGRQQRNKELNHSIENYRAYRVAVMVSLSLWTTILKPFARNLFISSTLSFITQYDSLTLFSNLMAFILLVHLVGYFLWLASNPHLWPPTPLTAVSFLGAEAERSTAVKNQM